MGRHRSEFPHGTRSRYMQGCRCALCEEARKLYNKQVRNGRYGRNWKGEMKRDTGEPFTTLLNIAGRLVRFPAVAPVHTQRGAVEAYYVRVGDEVRQCCAKGVHAQEVSP